MDNIYYRFGGQLFRQTVGIPMGINCAPLLADLFLYSYENQFLDKLIKEALIFTSKNSPFLRLRNQLQLLLFSTYFLLEMRTTTLPPNYMTNAFGFHVLNFSFFQYSISTSLQCLCISTYSVVQIIVTFYHATGPLGQDICHRTTKLIVCPTHSRNSMADTLI